ncbi:MAG TPA: DUF3224 domain-containing protein [Thermoanaerobaculia bacterium]|nr:DUF3224 domain-containing protein [Thermoanaerobaculia bacterium]
MSSQAAGQFEVKSWEEQAAVELAGARALRRAHVKTVFRGGIEGEGTVEYVMMYRDDGTASFIGYELVSAKIGERSGTFVLEYRGTFDQGVAQAESRVVPGSGTGDLVGLAGSGHFAAPSREGNFTLDYTLEANG